MSSNKEFMAANRTGPLGGATAVADPRGSKITAISLTTTTTTTDLSDANHFNGTTYQDRFVTLSCDAAVAYYWSDDASNTVDPAAVDATNRSQQCAVLAPSVDKDECPPARYLAARAVTGTATLRVCITNPVKGN